MAYWIDTGTGTPTDPGTTAVIDAVRQYATEGGAGVSPTVPGAEWFNMMTDEVLAVLAEAGITPDKASHGQLLEAILALVDTGRLIGVKRFTSSGTYTPTPGTKSVVVEVQGGGGAGGGAATTGASTISAAIGGAAGSYGRGLFTSGFAGVSVTIGVGGVGVSGGAGSSGGASSFGGLISAPGGVGAPVGLAGVPSGFTSTGFNSGAPTGANISSVLGQGGGSPAGLAGPLMSLGGVGGGSYFGCGGSGENGVTGTLPTAGVNPGSGGGGAASGNNSAITKSGKNGAAGIVIVWEYA